MLRYALAMCALLFAGNVQAAALPYGGSGPVATDLIALSESVGRAGKTAHQNNAQKWGMMTATANIQLAQARSTPRSPQEQLRSLVDALGNGGTAYLSRIACMNGDMARRRDTKTGGYFDSRPDVTVGQACRGLMEFSADATARGDNTPAELLAPYRELVDFSSTNPNPQRNQAAQALVNGFVDGSRRVYPNSTGLPVQLDGQGKTYQLTPGAALDASFTKTVSEYLAGVRGVPNRITSWDEARVNSAVETCVRGRDTLSRCDAVGFEVAAIYLSRPRSERQPR